MNILCVFFVSSLPITKISFINLVFLLLLLDDYRNDSEQVLNANGLLDIVHSKWWRNNLGIHRLEHALVLSHLVTKVASTV